MHDIELLVTCVGLSIICLYPADDVRDSISCPTGLLISFFLHLEHQALKSPVITEHKGSLSFILLISKSNLVQKSSNSS